MTLVPRIEKSLRIKDFIEINKLEKYKKIYIKLPI